MIMMDGDPQAGVLSSLRDAIHPPARFSQLKLEILLRDLNLAAARLRLTVTASLNLLCSH